DGTTIQKGPVSPLSIYSGDSESVAPAATKQVRWEGNLSTSDTEAVIMMNFFDSLGNEYSVPFKAEKILTGADAGQWTLEIPTTTNADGDPVVKIGFNGKSYTIEPDKFKLDSAVLSFDSDGKLPDPAPAVSLSFTGGTLTPVDGAPDAIALTIDEIDITVDVSKMTHYNQKTTVQSYRGDGSGAGSGQAPGQLNGVNVGPDGIITGRYTNGDSKVLGQISVAKFRNPAGLQKVGANLFDTTPNSGDFDMIGEDPILNSGVLEMSNVDLSREFTEMITTQRGFQANSRVITSSDEMLQELVNLKR
ncbi:MAG: flagellar hook-basal body complex protein, partial [Epulopiscium sp.]|nr:flagellar hook-basal body complex protein [Candidatus Epulonipiscium sp.]